MSLSKHEIRSLIHQGAGMEARNNVQNMVKLLIERSQCYTVRTIKLGTLLVLAAQPQDVE